MRAPAPVGLHEELPEADLGRCRTPRCRLCWLWISERTTATEALFLVPALRHNIRGLGDGLDAGCRGDLGALSLRLALRLSVPAAGGRARQCPYCLVASATAVG